MTNPAQSVKHLCPVEGCRFAYSHRVDPAVMSADQDAQVVAGVLRAHLATHQQPEGVPMRKKTKDHIAAIGLELNRQGHRLNTITGALSERIQALEPPMQLTAPVPDATEPLGTNGCSQCQWTEEARATACEPMPDPQDLLSEESLDDMEADLDAHPGPKIHTLSEFAHQHDLLAHAMFSPGTPNPYLMAEPTNPNALVVDDGKVWRQVSAHTGMWESDDHGDWVAWGAFTDPQPYQNCTLTADDPEPPVGSVVRSAPGVSLVRLRYGWYTHGSIWPSRMWSEICAPTVTLLYRGKA